MGPVLAVDVSGGSDAGSRCECWGWGQEASEVVFLADLPFSIVLAPHGFAWKDKGRLKLLELLIWQNLPDKRELSVCAMAVLQNRRGLWGSELTSRRGPSKAGELGACLLRHQAFQKPPPIRRLLKGLVHQQTGTQLPRDRKHLGPGLLPSSGPGFVRKDVQNDLSCRCTFTLTSQRISAEASHGVSAEGSPQHSCQALTWADSSPHSMVVLTTTRQAEVGQRVSDVMGVSRARARWMAICGLKIPRLGAPPRAVPPTSRPRNGRSTAAPEPGPGADAAADPVGLVAAGQEHIQGPPSSCRPPFGPAALALPALCDLLASATGPQTRRPLPALLPCGD
ncbi:hypothetical protein QTO34_005412 [Cnephaeus nilssonii]|uniref:Uncharacterized protein n=1 Tax=Cnephaeus nilssonii TaxID=3371016 RepID=A0AA40HP93_CNENI|nr:hypothetical protein QTO34_005412 [Eptesicus nilssonii]